MRYVVRTDAERFLGVLTISPLSDGVKHVHVPRMKRGIMDFLTMSVEADGLVVADGDDADDVATMGAFEAWR